MDTTMLALLPLGAIALVALTEATVRRSDIGMGLVVAIIVIDELNIEDFNLVVGPARFLPRDLVIIVLLVSVTARLLRALRVTPLQMLLLGIGAFTIWSLARGVDAFGLPAALNEGRRFLLLLAVALYFSTVERNPLLWERLGKLFLLAGGALAVLSVVRWAGNAAGLTGVVFGSGDSIRVLHSDPALLIAQAGVLTFPWLRRAELGLRRWASPALLIVVVILQHRTVWIVTVTALAYLLVRERELSRHLFAAAAAGVALFAVLAYTVFDAEDQRLTDELADSTQSTATFEWRVGGWQALLNDSGPTNAYESMVGLPFGSGWERSYEGRTVDVSPHSFYVEPYLRIGLGGLGLLLLLYWRVLRSTASRPREASDDHGQRLNILDRSPVHVLIATQLIYYVTYTPNLGQSLLLGLAVAIASHGTPRSPERSAHRRLFIGSPR